MPAFDAAAGAGASGSRGLYGYGVPTGGEGLLCATATGTFFVGLAFDGDEAIAVGGGVELGADVTERPTRALEGAGSLHFWTVVDDGTGNGCRFVVLGAVVVAWIACTLAGAGTDSVFFGWTTGNTAAFTVSTLGDDE